ncbi:hypothetical protein ASG50_27860 [Rhizobium sp. Leaf386]|nr:hypothetical protein ASG50_27860 [Rhizobium sp. Leaf386]
MNTRRSETRSGKHFYFWLYSLQDSLQTSGTIRGAVAGLDADRNPIFSIAMTVVISDEGI